MTKDVKQLREEFEEFKEDFQFSGQLDKDTYKRLLSNLKQRESSGDKKAATLKKQLVTRWEQGDRMASNFMKNIEKYGIDPSELG